jgi:hypothetical protein
VGLSGQEHPLSAPDFVSMPFVMQKAYTIPETPLLDMLVDLDRIRDRPNQILMSPLMEWTSPMPL